MRLAALRLPVLAWLTAASLLLGQTACSRHAAPALRAPPREQHEPRVVGVAYARFLPAAALEPSVRGRGAGFASGIGRGFMEGVNAFGGSGGFSCTGGEGCVAVALIILAVIAAAGTIGAVVGGIEGAASAVPGHEVRRIEDAAKKAIEGLRIQETLAARVVSRGQERGHMDLQLLPDRGPAEDNAIVDYRDLRANGIDTVVEVAVQRIDLVRDADTSRRLALQVNLRARFYRVEDGRLLDEFFASRRTPPYGRRDWDADGSKLFRHWLDRLCDDLARPAVERLDDL